MPLCFLFIAASSIYLACGILFDWILHSFSILYILVRFVYLSLSSKYSSMYPCLLCSGDVALRDTSLPSRDALTSYVTEPGHHPA